MSGYGSACLNAQFTKHILHNKMAMSLWEVEYYVLIAKCLPEPRM